MRVENSCKKTPKRIPRPYKSALPTRQHLCAGRVSDESEYVESGADELELYSIAAAEAVAARSSTVQILKQEGMMGEQSGTQKLVTTAYKSPVVYILCFLDCRSLVSCRPSLEEQGRARMRGSLRYVCAVSSRRTCPFGCLRARGASHRSTTK
jgi:hypothetical protein